MARLLSLATAWIFCTHVIVCVLATARPDFPRYTDLASAFSAEHELPHDRRSFTQGLVFHKARLYESTGLYGQSSLQVIDPETGAVLQKRMLPRLYFAEGITIVDDVIFLLTWRERVLLRVDAATLETLSTHPIKTVTGEGWGITHTPGGEHLIMSDGSELLYFLDPATLKEVRRVPVTLDGKPVRWINELEYIDGYVYANVWYQHWILKIDPASGEVVALLDLRHVNPFGQGDPGNRNAVLNGIAFDAATRKLYITGKLWPTIYVAKL